MAENLKIDGGISYQKLESITEPIGTARPHEKLYPEAGEIKIDYGREKVPPPPATSSVSVMQTADRKLQRATGLVWPCPINVDDAPNIDLALVPGVYLLPSPRPNAAGTYGRTIRLLNSRGSATVTSDTAIVGGKYRRIAFDGPGTVVLLSHDGIWMILSRLGATFE